MRKPLDFLDAQEYTVVHHYLGFEDCDSAISCDMPLYYIVM